MIADSPEQAYTLDGRKVGVMTGSVGAALVRDDYPKAESLSYGDIMNAIAALQVGKLDAVVTMNTTAVRVTRRNPGLMIEGELLDDEVISPVLRKENTELLDQVNQILGELRSDGLLDEMIARWIDLDDPEMPDIPRGGTGVPLRVGTTATRAPFSYKLSSGEIIGLSPELAYRIGEKLNRRIEFVETDFAGLIPALQSGKSDIIIDLLTYTPARAEFVSFADSYYTSGNIILRRDPAYAGTSGFLEKFGSSFRKNLAEENRWRILINGLTVTIVITIGAFILSTLMGITLCFFALGGNRVLKHIGIAYSTIIRGIPIVVLLMIVFYILFSKVNINPVYAAILAFGLSSGSLMGTIFKTAILTVNKGQIEAARAMGFGPVRTFILITLPQSVRVALPAYKAEFIAVFKGTAVVGFIAVVDLTKAGDIIRSQTFDAFFPLFTVALVYMAGISLFIGLFDYIDRLTNRRSKTGKK